MGHQEKKFKHQILGIKTLLQEKAELTGQVRSWQDERSDSEEVEDSFCPYKLTSVLLEKQPFQQGISGRKGTNPT